MNNDQKYKADAGKSNPALLEKGFPYALAFIRATLDYGAQKYEEHSWRTVEDGFNRYDKAARRHRVARDMDQFLSTDAESGLPHIAHELFNLMAQIELHLQESGYNSDEVMELLKWKAPPTDHKSDAEVEKAGDLPFIGTGDPDNVDMFGVPRVDTSISGKLARP